MPRILIVAPSWIGDTLLAQPLLRRLHDRPGRVSIDALAPPWCGPLLARMPEIGEVITSPFAHGELKLRARWQLGRELAKRQYDQAIVLPNSFKSALIPFFADIPLRAGYAGESRYGLLNLVHKLDPEKLPLDGRALRPTGGKTGREIAASAAPGAAAGRSGQYRTHHGAPRPGPLAADRRVLPRGGIRPGQTLAGAAFRGARARVERGAITPSG